MSCGNSFWERSSWIGQVNLLHSASHHLCQSERHGKQKDKPFLVATHIVESPLSYSPLLQVEEWIWLLLVVWDEWLPSDWSQRRGVTPRPGGRVTSQRMSKYNLLQACPLANCWLQHIPSLCSKSLHGCTFGSKFTQCSAHALQKQFSPTGKAERIWRTKKAGRTIKTGK